MSWVNSAWPINSAALFNPGIENISNIFLEKNFLGKKCLFFSYSSGEVYISVRREPF